MAGRRQKGARVGMDCVRRLASNFANLTRALFLSTKATNLYFTARPRSWRQRIDFRSSPMTTAITPGAVASLFRRLHRLLVFKFLHDNQSSHMVELRSQC
jgi:hypothetical protein